MYAVEALQWMRTAVYNFLPEDIDNCSLKIQVNHQDEVLDCIIGNGRSSIMIMIFGDHIYCFVSRRQVEYASQSYARFIADSVLNRGLARHRIGLPISD